MVAARKIELLGVVDSISGHARRHGLNRSVLYNRLFRYGWTPERATRTPVGRPGVPCRMPSRDVARRYALGESGPVLARAYGVANGSVYRAIRQEWATDPWFAEEWDDILYCVPSRGDGPLLYAGTDFVAVPLVRRDPTAMCARPLAVLRRAGGEWVDRRAVPHVIRCELAEALDAAAPTYDRPAPRWPDGGVGGLPNARGE